MMNIIKKTLTLLFLLSCFLTNAQKVVIENLYVRPPFQSNFDYYYNDKNVTITLRNDTGKDQTIVFAGSIKGEKGLEVKLLPNGQDQTPIFLTNGMRKTLTKDEMQGIFNDNTIEVINYDIKNFSFLSNRLPADCYTYTLQAISAESNNVLGEDAETMFCINAINSINLISPFDEATVYNLDNSPFMWSPTEAPPLTIEFSLEIVELLEGQEPNQVFQSSPLFFERTGIAGTHLNYTIQGIVSPAFEKGKQYAWRIKQTEKAGSKVGYDFANGGYSEVWTFTYQPEQEAKEDFYVNAIYPPDGEAIPFRNIPFIIKWGPYDDKYEIFNSDVIITNDISAFPIVNEKSTINQWTGLGPLKGQQAALKIAGAKNVDAMTEEDSQYMPVGPKGENLKTFNLYEDHRKVRWSANIAMGTKDIVTSEGNVSGSFVAGMGKPVLSSLSKDELKTGKQINFKFKTSEPPAVLFPEKMVQSAKNGQLTKFEDLAVYEKCIIEISKGKNFLPNEIVKNAIGELIEVKNKSEWTELRDYVYKDLEVKFDLEAGNYFWRVKWLVNPSETKDFSNSYSESEIQEFCVGENCEKITKKDQPLTPLAECGGCKFPDINDKTEDTKYLKNGAIIKIGSQNGFQVKIISINNDNGNGEGILGINIKNLGKIDLGNGKSFAVGEIPMKVELKGAKVNKDGILIAGEITSKHKDGVGLNLDTDFKTVNDPNEYKSLQGDLITKWNAVKTEIDALPKTAATAIDNAGYTTPLGFSEEIAGVTTTIAFDDFKFTPTSNSFSAYSIIEVKEEGIVIPFGVQGTCLGIEGACQDYTLFLAKNVPMSNFTLKGNINDIKNATHLKYSFKGPRKFQEIHIAAEYEFKDDILKPKEGNEKVKVQMVADSKNGFADWTATVSMPPFKVAGVEDFIFELDGTATYDHSTQAQPDGMKTMLNELKNKKDAYGNELIDEDGKKAISEMQNDTWIGFYLPKLKVQLPEVFKADQKDNVSISVENLIIDSHHGLCGSLNANNVFGIGAGNLDGWYYSLDNINVAFFNGSLLASSANGKVVLPISGNPNQNATQLDYDMTLASDADKKLQYQFRIKPKEDVNVPIWKATMKLEATSTISISVGDPKANNGKFSAKADLNGEVSFETPEVGGLLPSYSLKLTKFEHFKIQSASPYLDFGNTTSNIGEQLAKIGDEQFNKYNSWIPSLASPQKGINGSPFNIEELSPIARIDGDKVIAGFYIHGSLNLSDDIPLSPKAGLGMGILASMKMEGGRPKFGFKGVELNDVYVKGELGPVSVEGSLKFYNGDNEFGDGFKGNLDATFGTKKILGEAIFGYKAYNFWYFNLALVSQTPLFQVGPVSVNGIGGGIYHNMAPHAVDAINFTIPNNFDYRPKEKSDGLKATLFFSVASQFTFNAKATLEGNLLGGALDNIRLTGNAQLIGDGQNTALLNGNVLANYSFPNKVFTLDAGVNGGNDVLTVNANAKVLCDFKNENFYIKLGTPNPSERIKVNIADIAEGTGYFMVGNYDIPDIPEPDPSVMSKETMAKFNAVGYAPLQFRADKDGKVPGADGGMAFGSSIKVDAGVDWTIFWAKFKAGGGFDASLLHYHPSNSIQCEGQSGEVGINGWYAKAQAYFEFYGGVGVDVPFFGKVKIVELKAAALLQAALPNPSFFQGFVSGEAHVVAFSGSFTLPVTIGKPCTIITNPFANLPLIKSINIQNGAKEVSILENPLLTLNYPTKFSVDVNLAEGGVKVNSYELRTNITFNDDKGTTPGGNVESNDDKVIYVVKDALNSKTKHTLKYSINAFENGTAYIFKNQPIKKDTTIAFTTGPCLTAITDEALSYAFPYKNQKYYLQGESNIGSIKLIKKIDCLFDGLTTEIEITSTTALSNENTPSSDLVLPELPSGFLNLSTASQSTVFNPATSIILPLQSFNISSINSVPILASTQLNNAPSSSNRIIPNSSITSSRPPLLFEENFKVRIPATIDNAGNINYTMPKLPNNAYIKVKVLQKPKRNPSVDLFNLVSNNVGYINLNNYVNPTLKSNNEEQNKSYTDAQNLKSSNINIYVNDIKINRDLTSQKLVATNAEEKIIFSYSFKTSRYNTLAEKLNKINSTIEANLKSDNSILSVSKSIEGFDNFDTNPQNVKFNNGTGAETLTGLITVYEINNPWFDNNLRNTNTVWNNLQMQLRRTEPYKSLLSSLIVSEGEEIKLIESGKDLYIHNLRVWQAFDNIDYAKSVVNTIFNDAHAYHAQIDDWYHHSGNSCKNSWSPFCNTYKYYREQKEANGNQQQYYRFLVATGITSLDRLEGKTYNFENKQTLLDKLNFIKNLNSKLDYSSLVPLTSKLQFNYSLPFGGINGKTQNYIKSYKIIKAE